MFEVTMSVRARRALDDMDKMSPALRAVVHDYGMPIVRACLQAGVSQPNNIRQLVHEIWNGARQDSQNGGAKGTVDWLLSQSVGCVSWGTLIAFLAQNNMAIVPIDPTAAMLDASMETVSGYDVRVTKREKHRRRLRAAVIACMQNDRIQ